MQTRAYNLHRALSQKAIQLHNKLDSSTGAVSRKCVMNNIWGGAYTVLRT